MVSILQIWLLIPGLRDLMFESRKKQETLRERKIMEWAILPSILKKFYTFFYCIKALTACDYIHLSVSNSKAGGKNIPHRYSFGSLGITKQVLHREDICRIWSSGNIRIWKQGQLGLVGTVMHMSTAEREQNMALTWNLTGILGEHKRDFFSSYSPVLQRIL